MTRHLIITLGVVACLSACGKDPEPTSATPDQGALPGDMHIVQDASRRPDAAPEREDMAEDIGTRDMPFEEDMRADLGSDMAGMPPAFWPAGEGVWGMPGESLTLPKPEEGKGIYIPDVQERFPDVDWQGITHLYIPAGHYPFIRLGNLPDRASDAPLLITNKGGQVRVGGLDHHYLMTLGGGSHWVLTGRFDPVSMTGDEAFPGHRGGAFARSQGTYGIVVDDEFVRESVSGIGIGGGATHFEVEYVEIARVGFAGMLIKTDDQGDAHMEGVKLHDNYLHDIKSEGIYVGSTQMQPQHQIRDIEIWNNRILRTGTEAIQLGQLAGHTRVHHNVFGPAAIDWRAAFQRFQDNNFQFGIRAGQADIHHNIFLGASGSMMSFFAQEVGRDDSSNNMGVTVADNYFGATRNLGMYINNVSLPQMSYTIARNYWMGWRFERDEVYEDATAYSHLLRIANTSTPVLLEQNTWQGPEQLTNGLPDPDGNGERDNFTGMGNTRQESAVFLEFEDSGLPDDFDWLDLEMWTPSASLGQDRPVAYDSGEVVMHEGLAWRCKRDPCPAGKVPPDSPDVWESLGQLPDDVRISAGTEFEALGLQPEFAR